jgi:hypothetical protein
MSVRCCRWLACPCSLMCAVTVTRQPPLRKRKDKTIATAQPAPPAPPAHAPPIPSSPQGKTMGNNPSGSQGFRWSDRPPAHTPVQGNSFSGHNKTLQTRFRTRRRPVGRPKSLEARMYGQYGCRSNWQWAWCKGKRRQYDLPCEM